MSTTNLRISAPRDGSGKLVIGLIVLALLALGLIGLLLPIIPGLLLLAIAAVLAARHFPSLGRHMRRHRTVGRHLDDAEGFLDLPPADKLKLGVLLGLKGLIAGVRFVVALLERAARALDR